MYVGGKLWEKPSWISGMQHSEGSILAEAATRRKEAIFIVIFFVTLNHSRPTMYTEIVFDVGYCWNSW